MGASLLCSVFIMATEIPFQKAEIKSIMRKVADWQIANPHPAPEHDDLNWPQGALYVGMVDWAELAEKEGNDDTYYKWLTRIGRRNCWQPDKRFYHADDIAVSQSFLGFIPQVQRRSNDYPYARPYGMDCQSSVRRQFQAGGGRLKDLGTLDLV